MLAIGLLAERLKAKGQRLKSEVETVWQSAMSSSRRGSWRSVIRGPVPQQQMDGLRCFGLPVVCEARCCLPGNDRSKSRCLRGSPYGTRLRGMSSRSGIVPPRDASLRALSRSISDLRASRTSAVFSVIPVNSWAFRIRHSIYTISPAQIIRSVRGYAPRRGRCGTPGRKL